MSDTVKHDSDSAGSDEKRVGDTGAGQQIIDIPDPDAGCSDEERARLVSN